MRIFIRLVALTLFIGWVMNIIQLVSMINIQLADIKLLIVLKVIGIFAAPLGGILGWIN